HGGGELRALRVAESLDALRADAVQQSADALETLDQLAGQIDRGLALHPGPQQNRHELGVAERAGSQGQQALSRTFPYRPVSNRHVQSHPLNGSHRVPMTLKGKKILLGMTGGIAAYKAAELTRLFVKNGADVRVAMTEAATRFVGTATMQALSGQPVWTDLWDPRVSDAMGHIELSRDRDLILIAPASADFMAKLAHGYADDLLSTLCVARRCPLMVAPAMNVEMWQNAATEECRDAARRRRDHRR